MSVHASPPRPLAASSPMTTAVSWVQTEPVWYPSGL